MNRRSGMVAGCLMLAWVIAWLGCAKTSDREIWAEVNGTPIYREDTEKFYRILLLRNLEARTLEEATGFKLSILNEMISNEILVQQARRSGIQVSEADVDARLAELRSPLGLEEFVAKLREQSLTEEEVRTAVRRNLYIQSLLERDITSTITVTDEETAEYYKRNKEQFNVPETEYHLSQIVVTPRSDPQIHNLKNDDAKSHSAASQKIRALQALIKGGEDFAMVAENYSEDPNTSAAGGILGYVRPSALDISPELRQLKSVIESLEVGEVSPIVRTSWGYYLMKLLEKQEPGQHDLSDPNTRKNIRGLLENEKEQLLKTAYLEQLRNRARVENHLAQKVIDSHGNWEGIN